MTLAWSGLENSCRQLLSLVFFFLMVPFLQPSDLGIIALAVALNTVATTFIDEPIGEALVQKADITTEDWDTGFTVNLAIALSWVVLSLLLCAPLAQLLHEPALRTIIPVGAAGSAVGALGNMQKAYLGRALQFKVLAKAALIAQVVAGVVGVGLAACGFGYWALIANMLIGGATTTVIFWRESPWKPRFRLRRSTVQSRFPFVLYSAAIRSIYLLRDQSPLIIAGFLLNLNEVGFLSLALRVSRSMGSLFEEVTSRPLLSLASREQHDIDRFGKVLAEIMTVIGLFAIPGFVGLAILGPKLLPLVFGARWITAGAYIPWVCIVLACWLILHIVAVALRARSLGRIAVLVTAPAAVLDVILLTALAPIGLQWALAGWAARNVLTVPVSVWVLQTWLGVPKRELYRRLAPPLAASLLMAAMIEYLNWRFQLNGGFGGLAIMIGTGGLLYTVMVGTFAVMTVGLKPMERQLSSITGRREQD